MADTEERTVKVTFTADKRDLDRSLKSINEQVEKLTASLGKLGTISEKHQADRAKMDKKFSTYGVDDKGLKAVNDLVKLEENRLKLIERQNAALDKQYQKLRKNAGVGGGGGASGAGAGGTGPDPGIPDSALAAIKSNPAISRKRLSEILRINPSAIQKHIDSLRKKGRISRDSETTGYWEIHD